jgi:23S rRNA pseudouridine955/2504/2580 synthase
MPAEGKASPAAPAVRQVLVTEDEAGQRIDNYLIARLKGVPKSLIYRILRSGEVRINSGRVEASRKVAAGDRIRIPPVRVAERGDAEPAPHYDLPVLYEDEFLLAIDKPAGIAVHGGSGVAHGVIESLRAMRREARFLELVHRLDRDTSGLLAVARTEEAYEKLAELVRERAFERTYTALVHGRPRSRTGRIEAPIGRDRNDPTRISLDTDTPREAITHFSVERLYDRHALLSVRLETGRMHQIRVHLGAIDLPVAGDPVYGVREPGLERQFLHASALAFPHPITGERLATESPLPPDLQAFLGTMEQS